METWLQYNIRIFLDHGVVLDSGDCSVKFLGRYAIWLSLSCRRHVSIGLGAVPSVAFRSVFCLKMVRAWTALLCYRPQLLLEYLWPGIWWNSYCALYRLRLNQNLIINFYHLCGFYRSVYTFYSDYQQPKKEDREIQTIFNVAVQTVVETEVQHV